MKALEAVVYGWLVLSGLAVIVWGLITAPFVIIGMAALIVAFVSIFQRK